MSKESQEKKRRAIAVATKKPQAPAKQIKPKQVGKRKVAVCEYQELRVEQVLPDPNQPRRKFKEGPLQELMASIKSQGLQQPVNVTFAFRKGGVDYYYIKHGERRYRAHVRLGLKTIKCLILSEAYDGKQSIVRLLEQSAENNAREPQTHCENIRVTSLVVADTLANATNGKEHGLIQIALKKVAEAHGKTVAWANNYFVLSRLHADLQELLDHEGDERLSFQVALSLARAPLAEQLKILEDSKPFFAKNFHVGLKYIATQARDAKVKNGQKVRGRQSDHQANFLKFGGKFLTLCTQFQGVATTTKQWREYLESMVASLSVIDAEQMAGTIAQAMIPFKEAHALLEKKRNDHLESIGARKKKALGNS